MDSGSPLIATVLEDAIADKGGVSCTWWDTSTDYTGSRTAYPN
jgi:hypothetical protein